ncbi:MAG: hypothetical protein KUG77_17160 [Nannocystaceae bacterium]|nr:hypothetical protein [Nannocystaceae bacterium]
MHLTTLVELLERDVGSSASTRSKLADLLAERGDTRGAKVQSRLATRMAKHGTGRKTDA